MTASVFAATLVTDSRRFSSANLPARPPTLELSLRTGSTLSMDANQARLLPRYRPAGVLELRSRDRKQAAVLSNALILDPDAKLPLRDELTKPGDPDALRGIPAIGMSVRGVIGGSDPFDETARRDEQARRLREKTELAT